MVHGVLDDNPTATRVDGACELEPLPMQPQRSFGQRMHLAVGELDSVGVGAVEEYRRPLGRALEAHGCKRRARR